MANIPAAINILPSGTDITTPATAALTTMTMANDGRTILRIKVGATGGNLTPTVQSKQQDGSAAGIAPTNPIIALAANKDYLFGPFPTGLYNDLNGEVTFTFSAVATITVAAHRLTPLG
jgi:hypothetical protein